MTDPYAVCLRIAREHYENFPVASRLLPSAMRPHIAAIYAFARVADDIADEPGPTPEERLARLDEWEEQLHGTPTTPVFEALARTREHFGLPLSLFEDLLSAFRQDVVKHRYESWAEVLEYCRRSANPVGRLVLRVAGYVEPHADAWSDAVCTALQLTNFWQDLAVDWARGRLYVPRELWQSYGADPADLDRRIVTPAWRMVLSETARRTRGLFIEGAPVCEAVSGRLRYELRATVHGGLRILDKLERVGFDMFRRRPALRATDAMVIGWKALIQWPAIPRSTTPS